ncbi:MAG: hypothetical protein ACRDPE_20285 [Solirubrobacterales bacterium]
MRRRIEALLYGRRWRQDEHAWRVWQGLAPLVPARANDLDSGRPIAGRVERVYQQARRGTKALVHFGAAVGVQDTWWEQVRPPVGRWVVVRTRLWLPPGTHSEMPVVWIEGWESWAPGDTYTRALRHEQRLQREGVTIERAPRKQDATPSAAPVKHEGVGLGGPLFQPDVFATGSDIEAVVGAAAQIALDRGAVSQGPVTVADGQLLMVWPLPGRPTFASVTVRPVSAGAVWVRVMSQALDIDLLAEAETVASALRSRLGTLGPDVRPPIRESDFDRAESRRLEGEIQQLLETIEAEPTSLDQLSRTAFEREVALQQVTELGA